MHTSHDETHQWSLMSLQLSYGSSSSLASRFAQLWQGQLAFYFGMQLQRLLTPQDHYLVMPCTKSLQGEIWEPTKG